jgi:hypothetical protein
MQRFNQFAGTRVAAHGSCCVSHGHGGDSGAGKKDMFHSHQNNSAKVQQQQGHTILTSTRRELLWLAAR